jgi:hypothetical protein
MLRGIWAILASGTKSATFSLSHFMRILGIAFMSLFLVHTASATFALDRRAMGGGMNNPYSNGYGGNGMGVTGEGVGTGFLSCGCAEQIIQKRTVKGDPCDNYARLHANAIAGGPGVVGGVAPASAQVGHQLLQ